MNKLQAAITKELDNLLIENEFIFQALTTLELNKEETRCLRFEFINIDIPEVQILTSLFTKGMYVEVKSDLMIKHRLFISRLLITAILVDNAAILWECQEK